MSPSSKCDFWEPQNFNEQEISDWDLQNGGNISKIDDNEKSVYGPMGVYGRFTDGAKTQFGLPNLNQKQKFPGRDRRCRPSQWIHGNTRGSKGLPKGEIGVFKNDFTG